MEYYKIIGLLLISTLGFGQKYSNEFLKIGIGAGPRALGNAVVAGIDNVYAGYWNPAGLSQINIQKGLQFGAMHTEWFAGIGKHDYAAIAFKPNSGRLYTGITFIRFGIDDIPNTLFLYDRNGNINFDNVSTFSAADYAMLFSFAGMTKNPALSIGGNVKIIHRSVGSFANSWGFGIDAGVIYKTNRGKWGAMLRDATGTFNAWSYSFSAEEEEALGLTGNIIPEEIIEISNPELVLGYTHTFKINRITLLPEVNLSINTDGKRNTILSSQIFSVDPAIGLGIDYAALFRFNLGITQFQQLNEGFTLQPSAGIEFNIGHIAVGYAFTDAGIAGKSFSHIVSLIFTVNRGN
jgi:hypothetical protein